MTIRIIAKGTVVEVIAAAKRHEVELLNARDAGNYTVTAETEDYEDGSHWPGLSGWFGAPHEPPFPPGTLLWYGESRLEQDNQQLVTHGTMTGRFEHDVKAPSPGDKLDFGDTVEVVSCGEDCDDRVHIGMRGTVVDVDSASEHPFCVGFKQEGKTSPLCEWFGEDELKLVKKG